MTTPIRLEVVKKNKADRNLLREWRSDPVTRQMSFHQQLMSEEEFADYFEKYFYIKELPPLFAVKESTPVAFVGFDPYNSPRRSAEISIVVASEQRGRGIGSQVLEAVCEFALQQGFEELYAQIKPENRASLRIFEKAGFFSLGQKLFKKNLKPEQTKNPVFIIAEAGSNWRVGSYKRDLQMARSLIEVAKESGCDAIKFQTFRLETIYAPNAGKSDYLSKSGVDEEMEALFQDLAMPYEMLPELAKMCRAVGIEFMSTPFSVEDFCAVDPYVKRHKIASYEISHIRLLELAAKSKKPLFLSTGASQVEDISWALSYYKKHGGNDVTLLQCTAQYPAAQNAMNLLTIAWMKQAFGVSVGLSDHSKEPTTAAVMAVALGAEVIEKHFTLSRRLPGPDHAFAIEPNELKQLVQEVRRAERMRGNGFKCILEEEEELYAFARRRVQAIQPIFKGQKLEEGVNIAILRPGMQKPGVDPRYIEEVNGKTANRDIQLGEGVQHDDWK